MANKRKAKKRTGKSEVAAVETALSGGGMNGLRETIESIVIAFVLAFLFRTFEAEAFVIPTGSMSPSLQGQHKDVDCTECGYRFRATASSEGDDRNRFLAGLRNAGTQHDHDRQRRLVDSTEVLLGVCPMCRQTMAMRSDLPEGAPPYIGQTKIAEHTTYPGDRILVNKYIYNNRDPERWDVIVFKFPGNGEMNYIKRLIGLPNETLQIYQGDIFIKPNAAGGSVSTDGFQIARKPAEKVKAMLQSVHDSDYEASLLYNAGWPLRWSAESGSDWNLTAKSEQQAVKQTFQIDVKSEGVDAPIHWLRYHHFVPQDDDWTVARKFAESGEYPEISKAEWLGRVKPELIRDFNPYNAQRLRGGGNHPRSLGILDHGRSGGWAVPEQDYGMHWVGDLAIRCELQVSKAVGEIHLDLVEAGQHFTCRIDLKTGEAKLGIAGNQDLVAAAKTSLSAPGEYQLLFANVDDQLLLWIDDELIELTATSSGLHYDADQVFGDRKNALPTTSEGELDDLAPVGIGVRGTTVSVKRLEVLRDIYYIATDHEIASASGGKIQDYPLDSLSLRQRFTDPTQWSGFSLRRKVAFPIEDSQFFVMGDNSPASSDCRLWSTPSFSSGPKPGGPYLDRRLLIGKAICVFWPHSWGSIPGASKLPGFPNFGDMRIVR